MKSYIKTLKLSILIGSLSILMLGCTQSQSQQVEILEPKLITTISQIGEPLSVIGEGYVEVESLMGTGVDPHLYQVTPGDVEKLNAADAIVYSGLHLEANMLEVFEEMGKNKPVVAISETIDEKSLLSDETGAVDPHVWFDIQLWKQALDAGVEVMIELAPDAREEIEAQKEAYFTKLDALYEESQTLLHEIDASKRYLVTAHDAFGYFGKAYNFNVVGLQGLSTESEAGLSDIQSTIKLLSDNRIPAVFIESSINPASIEAVIEGAKRDGHQVSLGGELYSDAMGPDETDEGTYIGMYRHNVETIYTALKEE